MLLAREWQRKKKREKGTLLIKRAGWRSQRGGGRDGGGMREGTGIVHAPTPQFLRKKTLR
jgi:hypothetical protein